MASLLKQYNSRTGAAELVLEGGRVREGFVELLKLLTL